MGTFRRGDVSLTFEQGEKIDTLIAIADSVEEYKKTKTLTEHLRKIKHGHKFTIGYRCEECGLDYLKYYLEHDQDISHRCPAILNDMRV